MTQEYPAEETFNVVEEDSLPALTNISGLSVHEVIWIDIRSIQVKQNDGNKIVRVVTSEGTKDIVLGGRNSAYSIREGADVEERHHGTY